jgi:hypothetical protein
LILDIVTFVSLDRKLQLLYANGEKDPRMCELEVELHSQCRADPGTYLGYYKGSCRTVKKVVDVKQGEEIAVELFKGDASVAEVVVVDADHVKLLSR